LNVPKPPGHDDEHNVRVAILFSGGLDCTVLARLAHDILPKDQHVDLINVAFENPRVVQAAKKAAKLKKTSAALSDVLADTDAIGNPDSDGADSPYESCPDRETGRKAHLELQSVCPGRIWRFVAVSFAVSRVLMSLKLAGQRGL
jgi:3'-phosphoadenosine 5'-phosphosulfate sulfotransferase (PAPS reductase)/FAD synthetase